jgi:hypothetical protein
MQYMRCAFALVLHDMAHDAQLRIRHHAHAHALMQRGSPLTALGFFLGGRGLGLVCFLA